MRKIIYLTMIIAMNCFSGLAQNKIKGTVTYFFNDYQGNKADVGAEIFVLDSIKANDFDYNKASVYGLISNSKKICSNYDLLISRISDNMKKMEGKKKYADLYASAEKKLKEYTSQKESSLKILKSYNIETEDQFNEYDKSVSLNFMRLSIMNQYTLSSKANGVGDYNFDVPDGTYYVLIKSNSRKGTNVSEVLGKVFFKKIKVSKSKTEDISVNFDI